MISRADVYRILRDCPSVIWTGVKGDQFDWYSFSADGWNNFSADQWNELVGFYRLWALMIGMISSPTIEAATILPLLDMAVATSPKARGEIIPTNEAASISTSTTTGTHTRPLEAGAVQR